MSDTEPDVPPIPLPPQAAPVPPVEPAPSVTPPTAPPAAAPPAAAPGYVAPPAPGYPPAAPGLAPAAPGYAPPGGYAALPPARPMGLALASLILGIGSIVFFFFFLSLPAGIAAVITGHLAQRRQTYSRALWVTGLVTGYVGILLGLILGAVTIAGIAGAFNDY